MKMMKTYSLFVFALIFIACGVKKPNETNTTASDLNNTYANGFQIESVENGYHLTVNDPWQNAEGIKYDYILSRNDGHKQSIHIPVRNVICLSTTHIAYINELDRVKSVQGMSGTQFVYNEDLRHRIKTGNIKELGSSGSIDAEKIVSLNPDVVFAYVISPSELGTLKQLEEAGVPVVIVGEYLENHPLGKMEWLRFFAAFYDDLSFADSLVNKRIDRYENLKEQIQKSDNQPLVVLNTPWQGIWWMPGAESYMSQFIQDAGGQYAFTDLHGNESQPVDIELVITQIQDADIWLNPGIAKTRDEVFASDDRLKEFPVVDSLQIYNNNKRAHANGNDFYESAVVRPDLVLEDLIRIMHPCQLPRGDMHYYQELK